MKTFKCVCNENHDKNTFKKHFKKCDLFKQKFEDIDFKISALLKDYNPLLIKYFLLRYIKLIEFIMKKDIIETTTDNIKKEPINKNIINNNESPIEIIPLELELNNINFKVKYSFQKIYKGPDISDEDLKKISNCCCAKMIENNKYQLSKRISAFLQKNLKKNDWFVFIIDIKKKIDQKTYDFSFTSAKTKSSMIFIINNYKFHIVCC